MTLFTFLTPPRVLLAGLALLGLLAGCESRPASSQDDEKAGPEASARLVAATTPTGPYIRYSVLSDSGKANLVALNKAMTLMKNMTCNNPLSWYYQGAMHNVPGYGKPTPLCQPFDGPNKPFGWDGCTHGSGENHFLLWHRLYTWHLERIVRKLSGKKNFALPYWDYTNSTPNCRQMPQAFRTVGDSLYNVERYPPLNQGQPIDATMDEALDTVQLFQNQLFALFNTQLDNGIHGSMHYYIGCGNQPTVTWNRIYQKKINGGMMGKVPSAGFDPIFWAHHANIDFLWASWAQSPKGEQPNLAELKKGGWNNYNFIDENGKQVSYSVDSAYALAMHPDYRYQSLMTTPPTEVTAKQPAAPTTGKLVLRTQGRPAQSGPPVTVATTHVGKSVVTTTNFTARLPVTPAKTTLLKMATPQPAANVRPQRLLLQVETSLTTETAGYYKLYVRNQGGTDKLASKPHLVGVLNFFGATHQHEGGADMKGMDGMEGMNMPAKGRFTRTFTFDVTDEVSAASFKGGLDVQVVPQSTNAGAITIEKLTLLTQPL